MLKQSVTAAVLGCVLAGVGTTRSVEAQTTVSEVLPSNATTRQQAYLNASIPERGSGGEKVCVGEGLDACVRWSRSHDCPRA